MNNTEKSPAGPDGSPDSTASHEQAPAASDPYSPGAVEREQRSLPGLWQRLFFAFRPRSSDSFRKNLQDALESPSDGRDETISPEERAMLANILRLREVRVADVMVPRAEIIAIDEQTPLGTLLERFEDSGHSRMPVYCETLDDPRGMVHIRDVVAMLVREARPDAIEDSSGTHDADDDRDRRFSNVTQLDLAGIDLGRTIAELAITRDVLFVPPSMLASDLMARMQASRTQMALVIDEYGGTDGLVSLEDVVEMVVGDIEDEHDDAEMRIEPAADGSFIVDARVELTELAEHLGEAFLTAAEKQDDEVDTVGGLIFSVLGRVPLRGETIANFAGFEFEIRDADPRRIRSARIRPLKGTQRRRAPRRDGAPGAGAVEG